MSKNWVPAGRYGITKGLMKRLWGSYESASVKIVPNLVIRRGGTVVEQNRVLTESGLEINSENNVPILAE